MEVLVNTLPTFVPGLNEIINLVGQNIASKAKL